jgi:GT2 family glycosyltransferase
MDLVGLIARTHLLVLNYNGRALLEECLPSIVRAAERCPVPCPVSVVDNDSTDDSLTWLGRAYPNVGIFRQPNRGLASFNIVLQGLDEPAVLLLNNDVKLDPDAVGPLLSTLESRPDALFSAPLCWTFDGELYEGMRTRVRSRFGLVQGVCRVPGHESHIHRPDLTASAGPILAVDRRRFLELGGYDPHYFPGRIEDLDLGFRGWMAGLRGYYVPESVAYHKGFGAFGPAFGADGCDSLAIRNTLLFCWKNLDGRRRATHFGWLAARLAHALLLGRKRFVAAFLDALKRWPEVRSARCLAAGPSGERITLQEAFFQQFHW